MKNKIITIGFKGIKRCYLNISMDVTISRYCKSENISTDDFNCDTYEFEFVDEFGAYDVYEL